MPYHPDLSIAGPDGIRPHCLSLLPSLVCLECASGSLRILPAPELGGSGSSLSVLPLGGSPILLSNFTVHSSFGESRRHASHTDSMRSGAGAIPALGTQISISRQHAAVLISFRRYQPFLLVKPPPEPFSDLLWAFDPRGCTPSSLVPNSSMKAVASWWVRFR